MAQVVRNGFVESLHHGIAVITAPDGGVEYALGDPTTVILPRSSSKPLQAVGLLEAGARLTGRELALACASHSGEPMHVDGVRHSLELAGVPEDALRNTPDYPLEETARDAWIRGGGAPASITQNCSGKHAGMVAACVARGWSLDDYLDPEHPVQQACFAAIERLSGEKIAAVTVDGCGAPQHGYPLQGLARAFGRIAAASEGHEKAVADAMRAHPELVGGTGRDNTLLMQSVPGVIAKDGAEAVYAVGFPDGRGAAIKVVDGGSRARGVLLAAVLKAHGLISDAVADRLGASPVLGHGQPVGAVESVL